MKKYLIVDVEVEKLVVSTLAQEFNLEILDGMTMTKEILLWHGWKKFEPWSTLLVLPGNGASIVKSHIQSQDRSWLAKWPWKAAPYAKRYWTPGEHPRSIVSRISSGVFVGIKSVVVLDDVISSGETIRKLKKKNQSFIPNASWHGLSWVSQLAANSKSFKEVFSVVFVGNALQKVPINSLSTLIQCPEIAYSYAKRNFPKKEKELLKILERLR